MAKYKALASIAHNFGDSFISVTNASGQDFTICHLMRAAHIAEVYELTVDLLRRVATPSSLVSPGVADAIAAYCNDFGGHVQRSGAALDMISRAELRVRIRPGQPEGGARQQPDIHALIECEVTLSDDRGRTHVGRVEQRWSCHPTKLTFA